MMAVPVLEKSLSMVMGMVEKRLEFVQTKMVFEIYRHVFCVILEIYPAIVQNYVFHMRFSNKNYMMIS
jgi:hypothetical protein